MSCFFVVVFLLGFGRCVFVLYFGPHPHPYHHQERNFEQERTHHHLIATQQTERLERLQTTLDRVNEELKRQVDPSPIEVIAGPAQDEDTTIKHPHSSLNKENKRLLSETQTLLQLLDRTQIELTTTSQTLHQVESDLLVIRSELDEQRSINERLREENEVWEGLVGTRTMEAAGGIGLGIGIGVVGMGGGTVTDRPDGQGVGSGSRGSSSWKTSRREKGKSLADELGGFDLEAFSKGLEDGSEETERVREENQGDCRVGSSGPSRVWRLIDSATGIRVEARSQTAE